MKTEIGNQEFAKWLANWTKENQQSGMGVGRIMVKKKEESQKKKERSPIQGDKRRSKSLNDNREP
jgi:hypothetical protein